MNCLNCDNSLTENNKFCSQCGAKVESDRLTLKWYLEEFSENFLKVDNKLFKTISALIIKPEYVINGYIKGLRKKYFAPLSFLIVALTLSGLNVFLLKNGYLGDIDYSRFSSNSQDLTSDNLEYLENYMHFTYSYYNVLLFLMIPFLAFISKVVFFNIKSFNFFEHLVIYTYSYSLCSIIGFSLLAFNIIFKFDYFNFSASLLILYIIYHIYALRRVFGLSKTKIAVKTLLFIPVFLVFYFLLVILFSIVFALYILSKGIVNA